MEDDRVHTKAASVFKRELKEGLQQKVKPKQNDRKDYGASQSAYGNGQYNEAKIKPIVLNAGTPTKTVALPCKQKASQLKKAPDAPKRFKSAYILFSAEKHKEIRAQLEKKGQSDRVSRSC